jgi:hypothetical protein
MYVNEICILCIFPIRTEQNKLSWYVSKSQMLPPIVYLCLWIKLLMRLLLDLFSILVCMLYLSIVDMLRVQYGTLGYAIFEKY